MSSEESKLHPVAEEALDRLVATPGGKEPLAFKAGGLDAIEATLFGSAERADLFTAINALVGVARHLEQERDCPSAALSLLRIAVKATPVLQKQVDRASDLGHDKMQATKRRCLTGVLSPRW